MNNGTHCLYDNLKINIKIKASYWAVVREGKKEKERMGERETEKRKCPRGECLSCKENSKYKKN